MADETAGAAPDVPVPPELRALVGSQDGHDEPDVAPVEVVEHDNG